MDMPRSTGGHRERWSLRLVTFGLGVAGLFGYGCAARRQEPWEKAPLAPTQVQRTQLSENGAVRVERVRFYSAVMKEPRFFLVLVPKGDEPVRDVFILNHGWWDRPESLLKELRVDAVYGDLLGSGAVRRALIVLPDVRFPDAYRRHRERYPFPHYLTLVAEEVLRTTVSEYALPLEGTSWSVGGFSFGGSIALDIGRRYSGRFSRVSVVSAFYDTDWTFWPTVPPPPGRLDSQGRGKQTVVVPGPAPRLFLACGTDDRFLTTMTALHDVLLDRGVPHEWSTAPGGHTWQYWATTLRPMLRFHLSEDSRGSRRDGE